MDTLAISLTSLNSVIILLSIHSLDNARRRFHWKLYWNLWRDHFQKYLTSLQHDTYNSDTDDGFFRNVQQAVLHPVLDQLDAVHLPLPLWTPHDSFKLIRELKF